MNIKVRLYLLKRKLRRIFTPATRKALRSTSTILMIAIAILLFAVMEYQLGYWKGVDSMANHHETETPMCVTTNTSVRETPTGYILSDIRKGDMVWVVRLQVPFAMVWYYDGSEWFLGSTSAATLKPCPTYTKEL